MCIVGIGIHYLINVGVSRVSTETEGPRTTLFDFERTIRCSGKIIIHRLTYSSFLFICQIFDVFIVIRIKANDSASNVTVIFYIFSKSNIVVLMG